MYVIKRTNTFTGKSNWWANDTARNFWISLPNKRWLKAYFTGPAAEKELEQVKASYSSFWWKYSIDEISYSRSELAKYKFSPLDPTTGDPECSV